MVNATRAIKTEYAPRLSTKDTSCLSISVLPSISIPPNMHEQLKIYQLQEEEEREKENLAHRYKSLVDDHTNLQSNFNILKSFILRVGREANLSELELEEEINLKTNKIISLIVQERSAMVQRTTLDESRREMEIDDLELSPQRKVMIFY
ncbi:hypothetical protein BC833DRAFT_607525 [Globomyces pollinis-pini]|nr:hypothetical protein BC833DRAFT_607525 [Globomyces pollinis-pini]